MADAAPVAQPEPDHVCEHGTAMDVHCCHCHSGFIFDKDHECSDPPVQSLSKQDVENADDDADQ